MWSQYNYEDYACQSAFDRDPEKVWDFHDERRRTVAACEPNAGHRVIAEVQRQKPSTVIITQNIDGMHQRAGAIVRPDRSVPMDPRKCSCGADWRPDIVWFEDQLDHRNLRRAREALEECDLLVTVGTSGVVYSAADLPRLAMKRALTVEVKRRWVEDTPVSALYHRRLRGAASEILTSMC